jgi:hypothetical protein
MRPIASPSVGRRGPLSRRSLNTTMKYTISRDGVARATVVLRVRLTREEVACCKKMVAARRSNTDWKESLSSIAALAIEGEMDSFAQET